MDTVHREVIPSVNERLRALREQVGDPVGFTIDHTVAGPWLHVTLEFGQARERMSTIQGIDHAVDTLLAEAEHRVRRMREMEVPA